MCEIGTKTVAFLTVLIVIVAVLFMADNSGYIKKSLQYSTLGNYVLSLTGWKHDASMRIMTADELSRYNGEEGSLGLYIAIMGRVYDVKKGERHYGPDSGYHIFAGRDATRAFVSGNFAADGLTDDLSDLKVNLYTSIDEWVQFYEKDYIFIGILCGTFYDCNTGAPTPALDSYHQQLAHGRKIQEGDKHDGERFPSCNSHWKQNEGGYVWCADNSGGIKRGWDGLPRLFFMKSSGQMRCACVLNYGPPSNDQNAAVHDNVGDLNDPRLKLYDNCDPNSDTCTIPDSA